MIKQKEILLTQENSYAWLYEFPQYTLWKWRSVKAETIKLCKWSFLLDFFFGPPVAEFAPIRDNDFLVIDKDGIHWVVETGYLNVQYPDWFRLNRVKSVISVKTADDESRYFVGMSLLSHLGYIETVEKFKYEDLIWGI